MSFGWIRHSDDNSLRRHLLAFPEVFIGFGWISLGEFHDEALGSISSPFLRGGDLSLVCRWLRLVCECPHVRSVCLLRHFSSRKFRYIYLKLRSSHAPRLFKEIFWCEIFALFLFSHAFIFVDVVIG